MTPVEIPNRPLFKASEVCEVANVQPYVLRSWEQEFPDLGHVRPGAMSRVYRRSDLLRVLRIRQLVFDEGLTLSGARRKILEESGALDGDGDIPLAAAEVAPKELPKVRELRSRLATVRSGLRSVLELLDRSGQPGELARGDVRGRSAAANGRGNGARRKAGSAAVKKAKRRALTRRRSK